MTLDSNTIIFHNSGIKNCTSKPKFPCGETSTKTLALFQSISGHRKYTKQVLKSSSYSISQLDATLPCFLVKLYWFGCSSFAAQVPVQCYALDLWWKQCR